MFIQHQNIPACTTSFSATLEGYLLCEEPRDHRNPCLLQLSSPFRAPSADRALGSLGLYPLQLQLSFHSAVCMESPRTSQPAHCHSSSCPPESTEQNTPTYNHFNFSYPGRVPSAHRALGLPSLHSPQLQPSCQGVLCTYNPRTPPAATLVLVFLPGHLLHGEPRYC